MSRSRCPLLRAALAIAEQLKQGVVVPGVPVLPAETWNECVRLQKLIAKAERQRMRHSVVRLRANLRAVLQRLSQQLFDGSTGLKPDSAGPSQLSATEILAELRALSQEFDEFEVDLKRQTIAVVTDHIELQDFCFGHFRIVLDWRSIGESGAYTVVALDPHPAAADDETTHPHVQRETLCEGDGSSPIRNALADGRLCDFFLLVQQILRTYNSGSAYVNLEDWNGRECTDCGSNVDAEDSYACDNCSSNTCCECATRCRNCEDDFCGECARECPGCAKYSCESCLSACDDCDDNFCGDCLDDQVCSECVATREETSESETESKTIAAEVSAPSNSEVQPVRLGEAALPAGRR